MVFIEYSYIVYLAINLTALTWSFAKVNAFTIIFPSSPVRVTSLCLLGVKDSFKIITHCHFHLNHLCLNAQIWQ